MQMHYITENSIKFYVIDHLGLKVDMPLLTFSVSTCHLTCYVTWPA